MKLTPKQQKFVVEYLIDLNATKAAIRAGYSSSNAGKIGPELLGKTRIAEAIQSAMQKREKRTGISADRVLQELAAVGFAQAVDVVRVVNKRTDSGHEYQTVEIAETERVPAETRIAIASIKEGKHGIEVRMHDKIRALEMLGRHLGLFGDDAGKDKPDPQTQITALADLINSPAPDRELPND